MVVDREKVVVGWQTAPYASDLVVKTAAVMAGACRKHGTPPAFPSVATQLAVAVQIKRMNPSTTP